MQNKSILLGIFIFIIVIIITTGCTNHKALSKTDFQKQFGALGYTVSEEENHLSATKEDIPGKFEYYEYDDENSAIKEYNAFKKKNFEYLKDENTKEEKGHDFSKDIIKSDDTYLIISRVKNTIITLKTSVDYENIVNKVLQDINY